MKHSKSVFVDALNLKNTSTGVERACEVVEISLLVKAENLIEKLKIEHGRGHIAEFGNCKICDLIGEWENSKRSFS